MRTPLSKKDTFSFPKNSFLIARNKLDTSSVPLDSRLGCNVTKTLEMHCTTYWLSLNVFTMKILGTHNAYHFCQVLR